MKKLLLLFAAIFHLTNTWGADTAVTKTLTFSAMAEVFYSFDFAHPSTNTRPSFVYSHNRHNEVNLNLAFTKAHYQTSFIRANLALATGTYITANYANEPGVLKNIYEANIGVKLTPRHNLWIDAGIMPSHLGFESANSLNCSTLTRSIIADNSPYYESGVSLNYTSPKNKWYMALLLLNGWQQIQRTPGNSHLTTGTQLTYTPSAALTINYSTFAGNVYPDSIAQLRLFHNLYAIINLNSKINIIADIDYGSQQSSGLNPTWHSWLGAALIASYRTSTRTTIAARAEYYQDKNSIITAELPRGYLHTRAYSANFDYALGPNVRWRTEAKLYHSTTPLYTTATGTAATTSYLTTTSIAISL